MKIAETLEISPSTVQRIRDRYRRESLEAALSEKTRSGRPKQITETEIQKVVALSCGPPPLGCVRWTVRRLAEEVVAQKQVPAIGKSKVAEILRQHRLKPWRKKNVVRSQAQRGIQRTDGSRVRLL